MRKDLYPPSATFCKHCGYCLYGLPEHRCPECGHEFDPANPKTFRTRPPTHRLKWVIRAAVVLLVLAAVPVGYWGWLWWGWKQEQPVIDRLIGNWARVTTATTGPEWVKHWMPDRAAFVLVRATVVRFDFQGRTDADIAGLNLLSELTRLELRLAGVTDASMPAVGQLRKLKELSLVGSDITDEGLANLRDLRQLEFLELAGPSISGRGLEHLKQNSGLKVLFLHQTQVGDDAVETLLNFRQLEDLRFYAPQLTDAGLLRLASLPALKRVEVFGPKVTEAGCEALRRARRGLDVNGKVYSPSPTTAPAE